MRTAASSYGKALRPTLWSRIASNRRKSVGAEGPPA
ncbi:DUF6053 domain-containing protein [Lysobacter enzymogenes]